MNIQNVFNINFAGKVENKKALNTKPYLAPQKPDTFERTTAPKTETKKDTVLGKIANMYNKMVPLKLDPESTEIMKKDKLDAGKVLSLVKDITTSKTDKIKLERAEYDGKSNYLLRAKNNDDSENIKLLDKNLNVLEQENIKYDYDKKGNAISKTVMTHDFRTNTFCETKFDYKKYGYPMMTEATKIRRGSQNRLIRKETYEMSDIEGMYNVKYEFPNGKVRQISKATKDKNTGAILIEKDMRSTDMTRTQYRYEDDPKGNRIIDYKITSPDGRILMNQSQTFEVLGKNKFRSSRNDKSYLMELDNKTKVLTVTDEKKDERHEINLKQLIEGRRTPLIKMLKTISGDELINLNNSVIGMKEAGDKLDSYCENVEIDGSDLYADEDSEQSYMFNFLNVGTDPFVFLHELGHATDVGGKPIKVKKDEETGKYKAAMIGSIRDDENFKKVYAEERQNFLKEFPTSERDHINYFIADEAIKGRPDQGKKETIAETNAILNTYQSVDLLGSRTQYLQQHFPRTIAYLSEKLVLTK